MATATRQARAAHQVARGAPSKQASMKFLIFEDNGGGDQPVDLAGRRATAK
jgi:hypothetical protein